MSWYAPGSGSGISINPFIGISNGSGGGTQPTENPMDDITDFVEGEGSANDTSSPDAQSVEPEPKLSSIMNEHPDWTYEQYLQYMSQHSEEWAEKYLDYLTERGELDRANDYTAGREDSAYQRLVQDLRKAGLNPAMMYGSSASISSSGSQGYVKMSEGANARAVGNYSKIQKVLMAYMLYELQKNLGIANSVFKGVNSISNIIGSIGGLFV